MKKKTQHSQSGMTLLEVLIALSVLSIGLMSLVFLTEINRIGYKALSSDIRLGELILDNVNEIKGLKRTHLPAQNKCIVKYFDIKGEYKNETAEIDITSESCTGKSVVSSGYQIAWKVLGPSNIDATFIPDKSMKLPKYYDSVIRVEIVGWTQDASRKGHNTEIGTEVYVR